MSIQKILTTIVLTLIIPLNLLVLAQLQEGWETTKKGAIAILGQIK